MFEKVGQRKTVEVGAEHFRALLYTCSIASQCLVD